MPSRYLLLYRTEINMLFNFIIFNSFYDCKEFIYKLMKKYIINENINDYFKIFSIKNIDHNIFINDNLIEVQSLPSVSVDIIA